jgi:hypothetical protein
MHAALIELEKNGQIQTALKWHEKLVFKSEEFLESA